MDIIERMKRFVQGQMTWAEVEGFTAEQAREIAIMACDLAQAGRLDDARQLLEGLVAMNPKDAGAQAALGTVYEKLQRPQEARRAYEMALAFDRTHPVALAGLGELRLRQGDAGGYADLLAAVASDPEGKTAAGRRAQAIAKALALAAVAKGPTAAAA